MAKWFCKSCSFVYVLLMHISLFGVAQAKLPADAPTGTTAMCHDGSFSQSAQKRGACSRHKGVKQWYGDTVNNQAAKAKADRQQSSVQIQTQSPLYIYPKAHVRMPQTIKQHANLSSDLPLVWVNLKSGIYHCQGSRYYGETKQGISMPQHKAQSKGYRPSGGKLCTHQ